MIVNQLSMVSFHPGPEIGYACLSDIFTAVSSFILQTIFLNIPLYIVHVEVSHICKCKILIPYLVGLISIYCQKEYLSWMTSSNSSVVIYSLKSIMIYSDLQITRKSFKKLLIYKLFINPPYFCVYQQIK